MFSNVWSENTALFERLMEIHLDSPKLYYGFKLCLFVPSFRLCFPCLYSFFSSLYLTSSLFLLFFFPSISFIAFSFPSSLCVSSPSSFLALSYPLFFLFTFLFLYISIFSPVLSPHFLCLQPQVSQRLASDQH